MQYKQREKQTKQKDTTMKTENMMRRIVEKAGGMFDRLGFIQGDAGFDAAIIYFYKRREKELSDIGATYGEVHDFGLFSYQLSKIVGAYLFETQRCLRGVYRHNFYILEQFGQNHISLVQE